MVGKDVEALKRRGAVPVEKYDYHSRLRVCLETAKAYESVDIGITEKTTFQCISMATGMPTICNISELAVAAQEDRPTSLARRRKTYGMDESVVTLLSTGHSI
eukprot:GHVS01101258.1.p2 GENE.GHVS01101258.1~~GHVS01101258.1.p2  ORF type:complete len:111 (+),score=9.46 GHVS01101258.1:27-335(+)